MNTYAAWLLAYVLNSLWQIPLIFCAAWVASRLAKELGPRSLHRIWVGALGLMVVLPACRFDAQEFLPRLWHLLLWIRGSAATGGEARIFLGPARAESLASPWFGTEMLTAIAGVYAAVVLYFAARMLWGWHKTQTIRHGAERIELDGERARALQRLCRMIGIDRGGLEIATSDAISGPATVGVRRRMLLLPPGFLDVLGAEEFEALLAHELAHMARQDFAKNLAYGLLALPVSYHPVSWLARARVDQTREQTCDRVAREALGGSDTYARSLLRLAGLVSTRARPRVLHALGILDSNSFEGRIMELRRKRLEINTARRALLVAACGLLALITCTSAMALHTEVSSSQRSAGDKAPTKVDVKSLKITHKVPPVYPPEAKANHPLNGKVLLDVVVGKDGSVENIKVAKSLREDYDQAAIDAVRQWTFEPVLLNGQPIEVVTSIGITYALAK